MKKFVYTQNNSGGGYDYPEWTGPADLGGVFAAYDWQDKQVDVWVMAESAAEADMLVTKHAGSVRKGFALIFGLLLSGLIQAGSAGVTPEQVVGGVIAAVSLWLHMTSPYKPKTTKNSWEK